jgi:hypothetical protein
METEDYQTSYKNTWRLKKDAIASRYANAATQTKSASADCLLNPRRRVRVCIAPDFSLWASPQYIYLITFYLSNIS